MYVGLMYHSVRNRGWRAGMEESVEVFSGRCADALLVLSSLSDSCLLSGSQR